MQAEGKKINEAELFTRLASSNQCYLVKHINRLKQSKPKEIWYSYHILPVTVLKSYFCSDGTDGWIILRRWDAFVSSDAQKYE